MDDEEEIELNSEGFTEHKQNEGPDATSPEAYSSKIDAVSVAPVISTINNTTQQTSVFTPNHKSTTASKSHPTLNHNSSKSAMPN
jgi:hypothetical protein